MTSCVSASLTSIQGIQVDYGAYIPARISVSNAVIWPSFASFKALTLSNSSKEEYAALSGAVDEFVLAGFDNQPFMQGLSPKLVSKLTSEILPPINLVHGFESWRSRTTVCENCRDVISFYRESIALRSDWQIFLAEWSARTRQSDAILVPLIVSSFADVFNDRGIVQARRHAEVALFLIDTNTGKLIWARTRRVEVVNKKLQTDPNVKDLNQPGIDVLKSRLLTSDLWIDFPGRVAN